MVLFAPRTRAALMAGLLASMIPAAGCERRASHPSRTDAWPGLPQWIPLPLDAGCPRCADPGADDDNDRIPNDLEGCLDCRDSDRDGVPDWLDSDSDGDRVMDYIERADVDSDGDGLPDYLDRDSDDDGLEDGNEDFNGDGLLGCCLTKCDTVGSSQQRRCPLTPDRCGPGQTCRAGLCEPPVDMRCSMAETDPRRSHTFGGSWPDAGLGTSICWTAGLPGSGRRAVQRRLNTIADWAVALEAGNTWAPLTLPAARRREAAALFDPRRKDYDLAGFVVSRPPRHEALRKEWDAVLGDLRRCRFPGAAALEQRSAGVPQAATENEPQNRTIRYPALLELTYELTAGAPLRAGELRLALVACLLGRGPSMLGRVPAPGGTASRQFVIRLMLQRQPGDYGSGFMTTWSTTMLGAVAPAARYFDALDPTGLMADALVDGSALYCHCGRLGDACALWPADGASVKPVFYTPPVTLSMTAALGGKRLAWSRVEGFDYQKRSGSVRLHGVTFASGTPLVVSHSSWSHGLDCYAW
jgi:hypothetical protein